MSTIAVEEAALRLIVSTYRGDVTLMAWLNNKSERVLEGLIPNDDQAVGARFNPIILIGEIPGSQTWATTYPPSKGGKSRWLIQVVAQADEIGTAIAPYGAPTDIRNRTEELLHGVRLEVDAWTMCFYKIEAFRDTYEIGGRILRAIGGYFEAYAGEKP